jgi:hypothetical protein
MMATPRSDVKDLQVRANMTWDHHETGVLWGAVWEGLQEGMGGDDASGMGIGPIRMQVRQQAYTAEHDHWEGGSNYAKGSNHAT